MFKKTFRKIVVSVFASGILFASLMNSTAAQVPMPPNAVGGVDSPPGKLAPHQPSDANQDCLAYQGRLTNASGQPINTLVVVTFRLYGAPTGSNAVYTSTRTITPTNGLFTLCLGDQSDPILAIYLLPTPTYIGVQVAPDTSEMMPRQQIQSMIGIGKVAGVWGRGGNTGVVGTGDSWGVYGIGNYRGVEGLSINGVGVYGSSENSIGIYGRTSSKNPAILGESYGKSGVGVRGVANELNDSSSVTPTVGVFGESKNGYGVLSVGRGPFPAIRAINAGTSIYGDGIQASTTNGYAVFALSTNSYAGYFSGKVNITGNLTKGGGSFKIDHPLDPANKYLYHSFVESPDMLNIYNGNSTTDANGEAVVQLPTWFGALNRDFRYQLTPIGSFAQVMVFKKIENNQFTLKTDKPNIEVSWQVTGIRQDAYANANRIPVEEDKPANEKGLYLYPAAFNKPAALGVDYANVQRAALMNSNVTETK